VRREDLPLYARWFSDLELTTYLGVVGMSFMPEHEQEWYDNLVKDRTNKTFAIVVREGQRLIGNVSLMDVNHRRRVAQLGIAIGDKTAWGKGYGSEAVRLICDYGFTFLELHTIYLWHFGFNERGHRAYLKAGFKVAGRLRSGDVFDGKRYDDILMDITREDFGPSQLRGLIGQLNDD
jgi:RimJ/RimL family protein N-acetyltransferase